MEIGVFGKYVDPRKRRLNPVSFVRSGARSRLVQTLGEFGQNLRATAPNELAIANVITLVISELEQKPAPEAYMGYALYDADSNRYEVGKVVLSKKARNKHEELVEKIAVKKDGYIETFLVNETSENVWFDQFRIESIGPLIVQETHYDTWGLEIKELGYQYGGIKENPYLYNGKEFNDHLGVNLYDYGARMYDAAIGRFMVQDRFAEKYLDFTPYQYAANNPIMFIDVNGDSINVALIQRTDAANGTDYLNQITTDLTAQTGLTYSVTATGQLVYQTDESGNPVITTTTDAEGNTTQVGSQEARNIITNAISNTTTAYARITTGRSSAAVGGTMININPTQISTMTSGPQNVNPKTMGMGMTFMHETLHSALGGGLRDVPAGSGLGPTGAVVDRMNIVRREMNIQGANYGQRTSYEAVTFSPKGAPAYLPFDANSLNNLQRGLVPATTSKYLKF